MKRAHAAIGAGCTIAFGLLSRTVHLGFRLWDNSLGDALYAVLVYFVVAFVMPAWKPPKLGAWAFGISFLVELSQLTGLARRAPNVVRLVVGSTFSWHDVACYAVGALGVTLGHLAVGRRK